MKRIRVVSAGRALSIGAALLISACSGTAPPAVQSRIRLNETGVECA